MATLKLTFGVETPFGKANIEMDERNLARLAMSLAFHPKIGPKLPQIMAAYLRFNAQDSSNKEKYLLELGRIFGIDLSPLFTPPQRVTVEVDPTEVKFDLSGDTPPAAPTPTPEATKAAE